MAARLFGPLGGAGGYRPCRPLLMRLRYRDGAIFQMATSGESMSRVRMRLWPQASQVSLWSPSPIPKFPAKWDASIRGVRSGQLAGSYAYVTDLKWVRVLDVSPPSAAQEIAADKTPSFAEEISVGDAIGYVANYDAGVMVLAWQR